MGKLLALSAVTALALSSTNAIGAAFDECPALAFLTQGTVPTTYSVDLVTGDFRVVAGDMQTKSPVNGLGFNPEDRYIYGWSYEHNVPVRVHDDFSIEPLAVNNIAGVGFYVGDVTPSGSKYYVYRRGSAYGLYVIDLDPASSQYLIMKKVVDGATLNLQIADFAINPRDGMAYAVDNAGVLHQLDLESGSSAVMAESGVRGTYGAAYFDPDGNLYVSNNSDGYIYRLAVDVGDFSMSRFASGPSSNINDGSRCALAPVSPIVGLPVDFGDAPDSYGTYLDSNGARHALSNSVLYFGEGVDGESDASAYPLSDDENDLIDDEDGVQFATAITEAERTVAIVNSSGDGFVSAWIDLDHNGLFDANEQVLFDEPVSAGKQSLYMDIPIGVREGDSWSRFRLSSVTGLSPTGGAPDGEVEDFPVTLHGAETVTNYYPSQGGWSTVAFEDNWPIEGDYDMNDLVVYLRTAVSSNAVGVTNVAVAGEVAAVGAAYHNGFAIRLPGVSTDLVDRDNVSLFINNRKISHFSVIEEGRDEAILMVTYNVWDFVGTGDFCNFYRTEPDCGSDIQMSFKANIPLLQPVQADLRGVFDPFLFATPGAWHGGHFVTAPGRGYEIHLKNQSPTEAFNYALFDEPGDDDSDPAAGEYFQTDSGMSWALEIGTRWQHPIEYRDISHAYPQFADFVKSGGIVNPSWYLVDNADQSLLFTH